MKKILIVDDEETICELLKAYLREDDLEIITAVKMDQAEYAINTTFFDVVIADVNLSGVLGKEGLELLSIVKENSPGTKVIIMTSYGSPSLEREAHQKGAYFYFEKPIDLMVIRKLFTDIGIYEKESQSRAVL